MSYIAGINGSVAIALLAALYFIPGFIAMGRRNAGAIFFLNLFLGWTLIIWVACFIWACVSPYTEKTVRDNTFAPHSPPPKVGGGDRLFPPGFGQRRNNLRLARDVPQKGDTGEA